LARYIRAQADKEVQFLIISLKSTLYVLSYVLKEKADSRYEHADGLVGVYREQEENSSKTLSLDLRKVSSTLLADFEEFKLTVQYVE
jgi:structural maintenance of chromosome 1